MSQDISVSFHQSGPGPCRVATRARTTSGLRSPQWCGAATFFHTRLALVLLSGWVGVSVLQAQQVTPHLGYVYPAGGRQGTSFQVKLGGQFLEGVTNAYFSGAGLRATVLDHVKPITQQQFNALKEKLQELQERRQAASKTRKNRAANRAAGSTRVNWTAEEEKTVAEILKKLATFIKRPANPAIAETVTLQITAPADAEPGAYELRLRTPLGLSNPLLFCVGQMPEFSKRASKPESGAATPKGVKQRQAQQGAAPSTEMRVTLPATLNGQILPGGVDRYRFSARQGQQLVAIASARELMPYLPDAVPGWFQATLALYDSAGKELAYDDDYRFHPDPVLHFAVPADGDYVLEIKDAIYRGREDFVYRVTIGELPFITSIFPLGGPAQVAATVEVKGWNLPVTRQTRAARDQTPGLHLVSVCQGERVSNRVPFATDTLPECLEEEPNDQPATAQRITLPIIINGRIEKSGDWDVFRFEANAGDQIVAEVYARRLDSPLDSVLKLTDAVGKQLAFNDDHEDKGSGLNTHHADSWLCATLPAAGVYYLHLGDAQHQGGPEYAYRLRLSAPRPDFDLRVVPSSINARAGANVPITVYALRKDGFSNEIKLVLLDAPKGFALGGAAVPAGQDQVRLTLAVPSLPPDEPVNLYVEGRAMIQGHEIARPGVPAEDMMQAFAYRHLVPAQDLKVDVIGSGRRLGGAALRLLGKSPVKIPLGGTARVRLATPVTYLDRVQLELSDPPDGLTIQEVSGSREGAEILLASDAAKAKPGLKGNLIVNVYAVKAATTAGKIKPKAQGNARRTVLTTLPAIPFEMVGK